MRRALILALTLAGCVEPPPNPAWDRLTVACEAGDTSACAVIVEQQQRQKEAYMRAIAPPPGPSPLDVYAATVAAGANRPAPAIRPLSPGLKVCPDGRIIDALLIC